ncbi:imidazoleglycerol-phosphate dehydratase HisB [Opitutales bacterium ASA1]|jgi:imidazoleglycerol-phosphate dehydratase|uniref:imidazoleglycerol-phosphate dehydratase HisB n=1 Tax=Congregicoccus parvus TaxID=3081749 RepID=UPI002B288467|nr:imidazoleglycerol-phosphate dehydratase HisB [Opitutales bacterium ASA1]
MAQPRVAKRIRNTAETKIALELNVDGRGRSTIETGVPFFDHLLTLLAKHAMFDLEVKVDGDIEVDYHHTVEDVGIALGEALREAIGDKRGMVRYGFFILPMDECLGRVAVDLGGRPFLAYECAPVSLYVRDFNILLVKEFFRAFSNAVGANVHAKLEYGEEPHHAAECLFKCLARALDAACRLDPRAAGEVPSTKGVL